MLGRNWCNKPNDVPTGKEYSKADSRYATRDAFTIAMESITAFMVRSVLDLTVHIIPMLSLYGNMRE